MSSLFNKSTGISLASVLGGANATSSLATNSSSSNLLANRITKINSSASITTPNLNAKLINSSTTESFSATSISNNQINNSVISTNSTLNTTTSSNSSNNTQLANKTNTTTRPFNNYLKTIDNCLEEAARTGDLLLSNKSLIEFPSTIALKYDLTDTLTVDLSKNRLSELPKELLRFKPLEKLILHSNVIRLIPDINVTQLKCIKILDLNCNRLTYLPPSLCNLVSLEILTVNNNKLVSLPEEIGHLDKLIQLDVSCNEITHLPAQMGDMISLRSLNVRRNLLVELPKELAQLKLVSFDCTSNRISKLPLCFREMVTLIDLLVDNNPLELPPAHVCTKGLLHIMKYLLVEAIKEEKKRGVLTEYELNSQFNQASSVSNQRSSCNSSNGGMGSIGSFLFQSSVRNMCKKYSDSSSTTSSTESTSSSVSSASQLTNLKQPPLKSNLNQNNLVSKSINSISSSSSSTSSSSNHTNLNQNFPNLTLNNTSKPTLYLNSENVDYTDGGSQSLTSSPSSSSSASPPIITQQQHSLLATTKPSSSTTKSGSIHELLSLKNSSTSLQQQQQINYLKYNRNSSACDQLATIESNFKEPDQVWRLTSEQTASLNSSNLKKSNKLLLEQQQQQFDANFSIVAGLSSCSSILNSSNTTLSSNNNNNNNCNNSTSNCNNKQLLIENNKLNSRRLTNDYNGYEMNNSRNMPSGSTSKTSSISTPIPVIHNQLVTNEPEIVYDESLNPIMPSYEVTSETHDDRYHNQQQQQHSSQQVWVPRNDLNDASYFTPVVKDDFKTSAFTIRRHYIQLEQEQKQIETLRKAIESKLKIQLPATNTVEELGAALADGVVLCHLMNQVFPRAIQMIHVPSLAMPKLSLAKCRKNVENFIEACRRIGLDENDMCSAHDIIEGKNVCKIARTVSVLVNLNQQLDQKSSSLNGQPIYEYRPQPSTIGSIMSTNGSSLQMQPHQQQTAV